MGSEPVRRRWIATGTAGIPKPAAYTQLSTAAARTVMWSLRGYPVVTGHVPI